MTERYNALVNWVKMRKLFILANYRPGVKFSFSIYAGYYELCVLTY